MAEAPAPSGFARARAWWSRQSQKLKDHFAEYGGIAIATYFVIFALTWSGFAVAIGQGVAVDGAATDGTTIGTAWLATKATQPLRILATLAITPLVAAVWHRIRPPAPKPAAAPEPAPGPVTPD
ncbi:MAG: hypothetical protein JNK45_13015 [Myxococcales bacterium]|nr:hypothetical protein [Myxococcales bacterium]